MKTLRRLTFILLGVVLVIYLIASIFHVHVGSDPWTVALYALGGAAFIGAVICSMIVATWRLVQIVRSSLRSTKK